MTALPAPLTPAGSDLRDFDYMPLMVGQLRDSDMAATPDAEVFRAAVLSWCAAWHQCPAASLPDDDGAIARLIGMGRGADAAAAMGALRAAGALRGFIKCGDGRLYHPVIAERALISLQSKDVNRSRTKKARDAYLALHGAKPAAKPVTASVTASVTAPVTESKVREGKVSEGIDKKEALLAPIVPVTPPIVPAKTKAVIPSWVPAEAWAAFADMRIKCRKPMTERAIELMVMKLSKLKTAGHDPAAVLEASIANSWSDIYPLKTEGNRRDGFVDNSFAATAARVTAERAGQGPAIEGSEGDSLFSQRAGPAISGREGARLRLAHQS